MRQKYQIKKFYRRDGFDYVLATRNLSFYNFLLALKKTTKNVAWNMLWSPHMMLAKDHRISSLVDADCLLILNGCDGIRDEGRTGERDLLRAAGSLWTLVPFVTGARAESLLNVQSICISGNEILSIAITEPRFVTGDAALPFCSFLILSSAPREKPTHFSFVLLY